MLKKIKKASILSLADRDRAWDADAAVQRVRRWADAEDAPNDRYARAFLVVDGDEDNFTSYKYPIADVVDGELVAVPKALFAARAAASGGRGAKRNESVIDAVDRYDKKLDEQVKKAQHAHADMDDVVEMMDECGMSEADMVEASGLDADRVKALLHDGEKPTDDELAAMTEACEECEKAVKMKAAMPSRSIASESVLKANLGMSDGEFRRMLSQAVYARWGKQAAVDEVFPETQIAIVKAWEGEVWMSGFRLISVPYDAEDGAVTLGEVAGEVRQTYELIEKSEDIEPDDSPCEVEYVADRTSNGEYVIGGLNGEAVTLAKSLADAGVPARVEDGDNGERRVVFASRAVCKQLAIRATVEGEFEAEGPRKFVPFLRDEVSLRKAEEKGIVYGIVYEPDVVDKQGEWATAEDIEEAAHDYLKRSRRMKRQHDEHSDSEVVESYIAPADFFLGNRMVRKGSWVVAEQLGAKSKKLYKEGKLTGFSMGGTASIAA